MDNSLIKRQAAIDALREEVEFEYDEKDEQWYYIEADMAIGAIERLPSAQPEIIRCRDCKYFAGEGMYCGQNICVQFDHFYCYYGERKE